jgi:hypothetical protein
MTALLLSLLCLVATGGSAPGVDAAGAAEAWSFRQLMSTLAEVKQVDGVFEERKEIAALESPLVSSGFLHYRAPALLIKDVLYPEPATYRTDGDQVTVTAADAAPRTFAVDAYTGVRPLVESLRATLAGDAATLEHYFRVQLTGPRDDWSLRLEPRDDEISRRIIAVVIGGEGHLVLRVETLESGGDRTVMTITPTTD